MQMKMPQFLIYKIQSQSVRGKAFVLKLPAHVQNKKEEVEMLNMNMLFNYVGIKYDSGKCRLLTGLDSVMLNNLITYIRYFCEEDPNFVLCREDQLIIK